MKIEEMKRKAKELEKKFSALRLELSYCLLDNANQSLAKKINAHARYAHDSIISCQGAMMLIQEDLKNHKE